MKKTLGGDRLGSGSKQQVEMRNYERSTHNMGYLWRSTMAAGTLVPFMSQVALPGDTFDINLNCDVKTHPTVGPLFGSFKVQLDVFEAPIRLYQGALHNNKLGIGLEMSKIKLPQFELMVPEANPTTGYGDVDLDNYQINPSSILAYLGLRGIGVSTSPDKARRFNAVPWLAYWDIYKNYYANKQEEIGAVIHTPTATIVQTVEDIEVSGTGIPESPSFNAYTMKQGDLIILTLTGSQPLEQVMFRTAQNNYIRLSDIGTVITSTSSGAQILYDYERYGALTILSWTYGPPISSGEIRVSTFDLSQIDEMRDEILRYTGYVGSFLLNTSGGQATVALDPYQFILNQATENGPITQSQEGLALKTYQSDLFNNWLQTEWIDGPNGISAITAVDTSGGEFTIDSLQLARKVYDMLNRIAVSGGSYDDWLDAVYTHERYTRTESPIYHGGLIKELIFQEVISNAESNPGETGVQPLGTLAGRGILSHKHKGGSITIKVNEPSYIIGIVSITPRIDYSQGNQWDLSLQTMDDLHKPALDEIGFQELITTQMAWWDINYDANTDEWVKKSAGKQPAWINYMTNVNKVCGNFAIANNEMFMTLNRRYRPVFEDGQYKIDDLTTYIDPSKYNHIFAQTSLDSQNFWTQIAVDMTARRKISARLMPNL